MRNHGTGTIRDLSHLEKELWKDASVCPKNIEENAVRPWDTDALQKLRAGRKSDIFPSATAKKSKDIWRQAWKALRTYRKKMAAERLVLFSQL